MEAFFLKLVNMSIAASWLVLAVITVRILFKKAPKWILCMLWGLVAIRLICPFSVESAVSLVPSAEPLPHDIIYTAHPEIESGIPLIDNTVNPMLESSMAPSELVSINPTQVWSFVFTQIWILGMVLMIAYAVISYLLLKRRVAAAIPLRKNIKYCEFIDSPFVLGFILPKIYLPISLEKKDWEYVIAHEEAHIKRRDHWWKPIGFFLLSVYWFNPLLWLAYILLCRDIEAACDEKVIRDMDKDARRAYSTALLNCSIHRRRITACPLAFGEVGVKERITAVMHYKKPGFWVILIALIVCMTVAVCFLTNPEKAAPVTVKADFISRTGADLRFYCDESFAESDFQISETYTLEVLELGRWHEISRLSDGEVSDNIVMASTKEPDFFAWSSLNWKEYYGSLPDGTFRIKKELTQISASGSSDNYTLCLEFHIGGSSEGSIQYTLKEIDSTGAKLYEKEIIPEGTDLIYDGNAGIWLETWKDGQWVYLEPTGFIEPGFRQERQYIYQYVLIDQYTKLDWSSLYGALPYGRYRVAREVACIGDSEPRVCTAYAEFTTPSVITWFDINSAAEGGMSSRTSHPILPGTQNVTLQCSSHENIQLSPGSGAKFETVISGQMIRNVYLTDLTGDGISEICATLSNADGIYVQVYDYAKEKLYDLESEKQYQYELTKRLDRLCVLGGGILWNSSTQEYGQLALDESRGLTLRELDPEIKTLTEELVCVDIWTRKRICLSSGDALNAILALLQNLEKGIQPAPREMLDQAITDDFYTSFLVFTYKLGAKTVCFSKDFRIVWEYGREEGYLISDPEPVRQYVTSLTDGVVRNETSGEPFATLDTPWNWCANIGQSAVRTAQLHVYLSAHSGGSTSTNGVISYTLLQELTDILNQIPKSAFTPGKTVSKTSYHRLFVDQTSENTTFSIIDGVNNLGVILKYHNGKVTMLLTDELDKVKIDEFSYLEPTLQWEIQDERISAFMESVSVDPPVITYSVGAEYEWQEAMVMQQNERSLNLRLIEGWEGEQVMTDSHFGIRCRPKGITTGWIYFGFWQDGYAPAEDERYYAQSTWLGGPTVTSYSDSVKFKLGVDTRHAVWSYVKTDLEQGAFAIINEGADSWFLDYEDQINDIITLCKFQEA